MGVVLPAEREVLIVDIDDSMIRDRYAVRVAGQILQHMSRSPKRRLRIDHPVLAKQGVQESSEPLLIRERQTSSVKAQLPFAESSTHTSDELAAKNTAEYLHRQEEAGS